MDIIIVFIVYGILFLGELGDKTQLIVFNLALEYKKFYKVGIGDTTGFALLVTIGIFFGVIITQFIPLSIISLISGIVFITIGMLEARNLKTIYLEKKIQEIAVSNQEKKDEATEDIKDLPSKLSKFKKNPYYQALYT